MPTPHEFSAQEIWNRCFDSENNRIRRINGASTQVPNQFQVQEMLNRVLEQSPAGLSVDRLRFDAT
jgi:hypothetical protein